MPKIILDCDPGIDDALALFFALGHPNLDILAVTTVAGNRPVARTFDNARRLCSLAGRDDIPVFCGAGSPLDQVEPRTNLVHGADGLGSVILPTSKAELRNLHAAQALLDCLEQEEENTVTIVSIGPLTNLALALALSPNIFRRACHIAMMGGALHVPGNVTPVAEFNFWADPIAADRVLLGGVDIELFGLDVTSKAICTQEWLNMVCSLPGKIAAPLAQMVETYFSEDPLLHDPCPIAWLMEPNLFSSIPMHVRVETKSDLCFGKSIGWGLERDDCPAPKNANVHVDVDCEGLLSLMLRTLRSVELYSQPTKK